VVRILAAPGVALVILFATTVVNWLPAISLIEPGSRPWDHPKALILPTLTLVIAVTPYVARIMRASMVEVLESDYVEMARLKGLPERIVIIRHALPNALGPTFQVIAINLAYLAGGGGTDLVLDGRQIEEMLLTAAQTMMGVAVLLALRFPRWAVWALLALFLVQFALTDTNGRLVLAGVYLVLATAALVWHRQTIIPTLLAPFRPGSSSESVSEQASGPGRMSDRSNPAGDAGVPMTGTLRSQPGTLGQVVAPRGSQDLRGHLITQLRYPRNSIVVLAGIPVAGNSPLLHRLFGTTGAETQPIRNHEGVLVLDSEQARNHLRRRLQPLLGANV